MSIKIKHSGSVVWVGATKDGRGAISTESRALDGYPYGFSSRFEGKPGSNPEELLAAAHAACFTMATSLVLGQEGFTADELNTTAEVTLEQVDSGWSITAIHLTMTGKIADIDPMTFALLAGAAKENCPVSKVLKAPITLDTVLVS